MPRLLVAMTLAGLLAAPAVAESGQAAAPAPVLAVLANGNPYLGGALLAVTPLEALATPALQKANYTILRIGARRFVFVVALMATAGEPVGTTLLRLRDGRRPLSEVAQLLAAALSGKTDLVVLTQGSLDTGVVMAVLPLNSVSGPARVATAGATQATIFQDGREMTVTISSDRAGPMPVLDGSERESECRYCDGMGTMP